jgi:coenzyme F420-0:L-glutamate ligase/coenzyme F420-1:gamma-L-glutamate ligase
MTVSIEPITGIAEVRPGDDLAGLLVEAIRSKGLDPRDHDVLVVTQKVVSKSEGRIVAEDPDGKAAWVERETRRVVARRGDLVIAETRHGLVCANAGVDASNVGPGFLTLLPEDPDASAERIRAALAGAFGASIGVVVTDTFGRPWREGVANVAIGCAGLPALIDLRGEPDASGRILEATVVALADEIAAASGLAMGKAEGVPAVLVRGLAWTAPAAPASALIRAGSEDLFRESALQAVAMTGMPPDGVASPADEQDRDALGAAISDAVTAAIASLGQEGSGIRWSWHMGSVQLDEPALVTAAVVEGDDGSPNRPTLSRDIVLGAAVQALRIALRARGLVSRMTTAEAAGPGMEAPSLGVAVWRPRDTKA